MSDIKFQDPPPANRSKHSRVARTDWRRVADALAERPGQWALVAEGYHREAVQQIKQGELSAFRPVGAFDATARSRGNGKFDIYARFIGEAARR